MINLCIVRYAIQLTFLTSFSPRSESPSKVHRAKCLSREKLFFRYLITLSRSTCIDQQFILVPVRTPPRYIKSLSGNHYTLRWYFVYIVPACLPYYQVEIIRRSSEPRNARKTQQSNLNWNKLEMCGFRNLI